MAGMPDYTPGMPASFIGNSFFGSRTTESIRVTIVWFWDRSPAQAIAGLLVACRGQNTSL